MLVQKMMYEWKKELLCSEYIYSDCYKRLVPQNNGDLRRTVSTIDAQGRRDWTESEGLDEVLVLWYPAPGKHETAAVLRSQDVGAKNKQ